MGRRRKDTLKPAKISQKCGVIYAASGSPRNISEAIFSAQSVKALHSDLEITISISSNFKEIAEATRY